MGLSDLKQSHQIQQFLVEMYNMLLTKKWWREMSRTSSVFLKKSIKYVFGWAVSYFLAFVAVGLILLVTWFLIYLKSVGILP